MTLVTRRGPHACGTRRAGSCTASTPPAWSDSTPRGSSMVRVRVRVRVGVSRVRPNPDPNPTRFVNHGEDPNV
eukprot:scaffold35809_cov67-Phaeocystis_antarctica.AAC.2